MKLLLDNNLSPRIARALHELFHPDHEIVALRDRFPQNTSDTAYIAALHGEGGWAVLTRDLRIRTRPNERAALDAANVVFFFLDGAWKKLDVAQTTAKLILLMPLMVKQTDIADRGRFELPFNTGSKLRQQRL